MSEKTHPKQTRLVQMLRVTHEAAYRDCATRPDSGDGTLVSNFAERVAGPIQRSHVVRTDVDGDPVARYELRDVSAALEAAKRLFEAYAEAEYSGEVRWEALDDASEAASRAFGLSMQCD